MKRLEEALPRLKESHLEEVSRLFQAMTGVGCDGFHPKVLLDLTRETTREIIDFQEKVEQSGKWPQQACTTMVFLIPKNVTSERPIALMPMLIRWWEAFRAPEVAAEVSRGLGRHGWSKRRSSTNEMGNIDGNGKIMIWAWTTHFSFPRKILRVLCGYFEHQRRAQLEGCAAEPLTTITAILPTGSKWSCLLLRIVWQDALSEVTKNYPQLKLRVFVDDITALLMRREVAEMAKKLKEEIEKKKR